LKKKKNTLNEQIEEAVNKEDFDLAEKLQNEVDDLKSKLEFLTN
jgi:hypothetical protein